MAATYENPETLSPKEIVSLSLVTLSLALLFMSGFIPTAHSLFESVWGALKLPTGEQKEWAELFSFPILAGFFAISLPRKSPTVSPPFDTRLLKLCLIPIIIAFVFGRIHPAPSILTQAFNKQTLWFLLLVPIGEEWLFRGWFYDLIERWWQPKFASLTNPLPAAIWATSFAFSLWHLQNLSVETPLFVCLQLLYTFFTGLWLGYLRWKTGKLWLPVGMHVALNTASLLA